jgi:hypothetical protein
MRFHFWAIAVFLAVLSLTTMAASAATLPQPAAASMSAATSTVLLADAKIDLPKVDVEVHHDHAWYKNPFIIGLGVVVVVLLITLASRGGGTTIIER